MKGGHSHSAASGGHGGDITPLSGLRIPAFHCVEVRPSVMATNCIHGSLQHPHPCTHIVKDAHVNITQAHTVIHSQSVMYRPSTPHRQQTDVQTHLPHKTKLIHTHAHTHTESCTPSLSLTHTCTQSRTLSLSYTHTHTESCTHPLSHTCTHIHTHILRLYVCEWMWEVCVWAQLTHTRMHTHTHTVISSHIHTVMSSH